MTNNNKKKKNVKIEGAEIRILEVDGYTVLPNAIIICPELTDREFRVFSTLLMHVRQSATYTIRQRILGKELKKHEKTIGIIIRSLEKKGHIVKIRGGRGHADTYFLNFRVGDLSTVKRWIKNAGNDFVTSKGNDFVTSVRKKDIYKENSISLKKHRPIEPKNSTTRPKTAYEQMLETKNRSKGDGLIPDYSASQN